MCVTFLWSKGWWVGWQICCQTGGWKVSLQAVIKCQDWHISRGDFEANAKCYFSIIRFKKCLENVYILWFWDPKWFIMKCDLEYYLFGQIISFQLLFVFLIYYYYFLCDIFLIASLPPNPYIGEWSHTLWGTREIGQRDPLQVSNYFQVLFFILKIQLNIIFFSLINPVLVVMF